MQERKKLQRKRAQPLRNSKANRAKWLGQANANFKLKLYLYIISTVKLYILSYVLTHVVSSGGFHSLIFLTLRNLHGQSSKVFPFP